MNAMNFNGSDAKAECRSASLRHGRALTYGVSGETGKASDVGETRLHHDVIGDPSILHGFLKPCCAFIAHYYCALLRCLSSHSRDSQAWLLCSHT